MAFSDFDSSDASRAAAAAAKAMAGKGKGFALKGVAAAVLGVAAISVFNSSVFYAEPGYIYHVRTVLGAEEVVKDVGYHFYPMGRWNAWKRALTVQSVKGATGLDTFAEVESEETSASMPPMSIVFLDQVDAGAEATVRFSLPDDTESFLRVAREYRSPANLLRTALIPAYKETLQATASLMNAEDYYSGARTKFNSDFEDQMQGGVYHVERVETVQQAPRVASGSANAALGEDQQTYGDDQRVVFEVRKITDEAGRPMRKEQKFVGYGITVVDARITDMTPNGKFVERMQLKQRASADRAIAREKRIQEEEQKLLAVATGEREVAERQAKAKVEQIEKTTNAETSKQLAITEAQKNKAQAEIDRETAAIELEKAKLEAQTKRTLADAEAYQKREVLKADNALADKLKAEIAIHGVWADAFAKRAVPTTVFGGSGAGGPATGSDAEVKAFMQMLTMDAARRLSYDREVGKKE